MKTWNIYHEPADTDEPASLLGDVDADTMSQALQEASEFFEIPAHDLIAKDATIDGHIPSESE